MKRFTMWTVIGALVLMIVVSTAGCTSTTSPSVTSTPTPIPTSTSTTSEAVQNKYIPISAELGITFDSNITVKQGTRVIWENLDTKSHSITSETGVFDSGNIAPGNQFAYLFNEKGIFPYRYDGVGTHSAFGSQIPAPQINVQ